MAPFERRDLNFRPVLSFDDWEVQPVHGRSALTTHILFRGNKPTCNHVGHIADGKPMDLLYYAASHAFWDLKVTTLRKVARDEVEEPLPNVPLAQTLTFLVRHIMKITEEEALEIVGQRCIKSTDAEGQLQILTSDAADDCIQKGDKKELEDYVKKLEDEVAERNAVHEHVSRGLSQRPRGAVRTVPDGHISEAKARELLPPRSRILRDPYYGRWRVWYRFGLVQRDKSLAWGPSGDERAVVIPLLQWVWKIHGRLSPTPCRVTNLFPPEPPQPEAQAAPSASRREAPPPSPAEEETA